MIEDSSSGSDPGGTNHMDIIKDELCFLRLVEISINLFGVLYQKNREV